MKLYAATPRMDKGEYSNGSEQGTERMEIKKKKSRTTNKTVNKCKCIQQKQL